MKLVVLFLTVTGVCCQRYGRGRHSGPYDAAPYSEGPREGPYGGGARGGPYGGGDYYRGPSSGSGGPHGGGGYNQGPSNGGGYLGDPYGNGGHRGRYDVGGPQRGQYAGSAGGTYRTFSSSHSSHSGGIRPFTQGYGREAYAAAPQHLGYSQGFGHSPAVRHHATGASYGHSYRAGYSSGGDGYRGYAPPPPPPPPVHGPSPASYGPAGGYDQYRGPSPRYGGGHGGPYGSSRGHGGAAEKGYGVEKVIRLPNSVGHSKEEGWSMSYSSGTGRGASRSHEHLANQVQQQLQNVFQDLHL